MTARAPGLPAESAARVLALYGERGAAWLSELAAVIDACAARWELAEVGAPFRGARASFVAPARRGDGTPVVLKIAPAREWAFHEARALANWAGEGAVRLEAFDEARGAMLVERAVPGTSLARGLTLARGATYDRSATSSAAEVIARLRLAPAPLPNDSLPHITTWTARLRGGPSAHEARLVTPRHEADAAASALLAASSSAVVLHGDLHHENVLASERYSWLAADPKGVLGPPEAEASALLRNPRRFVLHHADQTRLLSDRVAILSERLGDPQAMLAWWGFVLAVVAACWADEDGEGGEDVARWLACAEALRRVARAKGAV